LGAAFQADGETRSVCTTSSIRRRSAATILLDWMFRSRRPAFVLCIQEEDVYATFPAKRENIDDMSFIRTMITRVMAEQAIDKKRAPACQFAASFQITPPCPGYTFQQAYHRRLLSLLFFMGQPWMARAYGYVRAMNSTAWLISITNGNWKMASRDWRRKPPVQTPLVAAFHWLPIGRRKCGNANRRHLDWS
jgi:hypothetical protein